MFTRGAQEGNRHTLEPPGRTLARRMAGMAAILAIAVGTTWLWKQTRSLVPQEHARIDSALRELRSLDRTVNQDVLQARLKIIDDYDPVRRSYRRIEQLEAVIDVLPHFLGADDRRRMADAVARYRAAVTDKERLIEDFKFATLNLNELLAYLPGAAAGMAKAASSSSDEGLAHDVNEVLQLTLLYNLTSADEYPPLIRGEIDALEISGRNAKSYAVRQRVRTLALNIRTLLAVKPRVDRALERILAQPIALREDDVANVYYPAYSSAEIRSNRYRVLLYCLCTGLLGLMAYGVLRMRRGAAALAVSKERLEARVIERTRELDVRNRDLRTVLDNVGQALFTVERTGQLSNERSAALDLWFPGATPGTHLAALFGAADPAVGDWVAAGWEQVQAGLLPVEVALEQLPSKLLFRGHHYGIEYRPINGTSGLEKVLVVISDVTEAIERSRAETDQREQMAIFENVMSGRAVLLEFFSRVRAPGARRAGRAVRRSAQPFTRHPHAEGQRSDARDRLPRVGLSCAGGQAERAGRTTGGRRLWCADRGVVGVRGARRQVHPGGHRGSPGAHAWRSSVGADSGRRGGDRRADHRPVVGAGAGTGARSPGASSGRRAGIGAAPGTRGIDGDHRSRRPAVRSRAVGAVLVGVHPRAPQRHRSWHRTPR